MEQGRKMPLKPRFNRLELSGSLGDLGALLPLAVGMIVVNGLSPLGVFLMVGAYFILSAAYFKTTVPVQPMKVIGAYAISTGLTAGQITSSGLIIGLILLVIGATGAITLIGRYIPKPVVRGVQLSTGILLMAKGVGFIIGTSKFQALAGATEPYLIIQTLGPIPVGLIIGITGAVVTFLLLNNDRFPGGLAVVIFGLIIGLVLGKTPDLSVGLNLPEILPFGWPTGADLGLIMLTLVLPQLPMTLGNAVIAYADLSEEYFGRDSSRVTYKAATLSMGLANVIGFFVGGMPMCHGAGGLAAHYRFGARTAGSNYMIGGFFVALAILLGDQALDVIRLLPLAVLGVLLIFAGSQLALTILDLGERRELFVALSILGITLATNLAAGFIVGIAVAYALRSERFSV